MFPLIQKLLEDVNLQYRDKTRIANPPSHFSKPKVKGEKRDLEKLSSKNVQAVGAGVDAVVYHNKNNPSKAGTVNKWVQDQAKSPEDNGTIQYLVRGNSLNNPFIPKVYDIRVVKNRNNKYDYHITMEKLHGTLAEAGLDPQQLSALVNQVLENYDGPEMTMPILSNVIKHGAEDISVRIGGKEYNYTSTFLDAIDLVLDTILSTGSELDLHANNVMLRLTSVGMQLVITDPLIR